MPVSPAPGCGNPTARTVLELLQQRWQRRGFIAEQGDDAPLARIDAHAAQPAGAVEAGLAGEQARFAQQPAGAGTKTGIEKMLREACTWSAHHGGRKSMRTLRVAFGGEVFQVDPAGRRAAPGHRLHKARRQFATERFDHVVCGRRERRVRTPFANSDPGGARRRHPCERGRVVDPQPHGLPACGQVAGQPPADAGVPVVVDDPAEDVPTHGPG
jgi:hypothetical protein